MPHPVAVNSGVSKLVVNRRRQEGNPLLRYVTNVRYEWGDIAADFECGSTCGVIYLAMKVCYDFFVILIFAVSSVASRLCTYASRRIG